MDNKEFTVEVTEEQHNQQLAEGLLKDEILSVGKHTFKRGGFHQRHPNLKSTETKTLQNNVEDITKNKEFVRAVAEQLKELLAA